MAVCDEYNGAIFKEKIILIASGVMTIFIHSELFSENHE